MFFWYLIQIRECDSFWSWFHCQLEAFKSRIFEEIVKILLFSGENENMEFDIGFMSLSRIRVSQIAVFPIGLEKGALEMNI